MKRRDFLFSAAVSPLLRGAPQPPRPYGAVPSARQLQWHELETYAFLHFTVNTFTDKEWGYGDEDPSVFNPTAFDADAIVEALKAGGMTGVILTAKHHDGFCLWPTRTTEHSVRSSSWRGGKGDVVREIASAAARAKLRFGVYLSPWDRNNPHYGTAEYVRVYREQLRELLTEYGPIFEVWHDGANGGDGYYGGAREKRIIDKHTYYDWPTTWALVRKLQPDAVIFSDVGPDIRWVGNEKGYAGETCWETFTPVGEHGGPAAPGDVRTTDSNSGTRNGADWMPPECDVSIRPGWFWHASENDKVKTPEALVQLYLRSVGRGGSMLLNIPPDRRGLLHENDGAALREFGRMKQKMFQANLSAGASAAAPQTRAGFEAGNLVDNDRYTYWSTDDGTEAPWVTLDLHKTVACRLIRLRENIRLGQRIAAIAVDAWQNDGWREMTTATSIGNCRLLRIEPAVTTSRVRLRVTNCPVPPALSEFALFG